jgi:hypothetical protein
LLDLTDATGSGCMYMLHFDKVMAQCVHNN